MVDLAGLDEDDLSALTAVHVSVCDRPDVGAVKSSRALTMDLTWDRVGQTVGAESAEVLVHEPCLS